MKSLVQNGTDHEINLGPIGVILRPGQVAVVSDSPAIVAAKLGSLAGSLHVTQVPDSFAGARPASGAILAIAKVASDGTLQTSLSGGFSAAVRNSTGTYTLTLPVAQTNYGSPNLMLNANALAGVLDENTPPTATAVASFIDSTHIQVQTTNPVTGALVDSAFRVVMIDFT